MGVGVVLGLWVERGLGGGVCPAPPPARQERGGGRSCAARVELCVLCEPHEAGRVVEVQGLGTLCCRRWRVPALSGLGTGGLGVGWDSDLGDADYGVPGMSARVQRVSPEANVCRKVLIAVSLSRGSCHCPPLRNHPGPRCWKSIWLEAAFGCSLIADC